jgi:hypothetical protein
MPVVLTRRASGKAHLREIPESETALISGLALSATGTGSIYEDAFTTAITIGGGAAQTTVTIGRAAQQTSILGDLRVAGVIDGPNDGTGVVVGLAPSGASTGSAMQAVTVTTAQRDQLVAANGMVVFNSTTGALEGYNGSWNDLGAGAGGGVSLAATLLIGSTTGGTDITVSTGDSILGAAELTLAASAGVLDLDATGALSINSSAGVINIGNDAVAQNILIGTGAAARTIQIGNNTGNTQVDINAGTGGISLAGTDLAAMSVDVATGGTGAKTLTLGSNASTSTTTINAGTGGIALGTGTAAMSVNVATGGTGAKTLTVGSTASTSSTTLQTGTGAMTFTAGGIFDVNATGAVTIDGTSVDLTGTAASSLSTTGAGIDLTLDSAAGRVVVDGGEAVGDAVNLVASNAAGGIALQAGTGGYGIGEADTAAQTNDLFSGGTGAKSNTIGSTASTSSLLLQAGTGSMAFTAGGIFDVNAAGAVTVDSSGGAISIGADAVAQAINVGTGAAARTITVGNGTGASSTVIDVGTGNLDLGVTATAHEVRIGSTTGASGVTIDTGTGGIDLATGTAVATVNLATGGTGAKTATLGSTASTSSTTLQAGTGAFNLTQAGGDAITVGATGGVGTGSTLGVPSFTTAQLGTNLTAVNGMIAYDSTLGELQGRVGGAWVNLGAGGSLIQSVNTSTASVVTATGTIPQDDTIPQDTEGTTVLSLAITPTSTANDIHIEFSCSGSVDGNQSFVVALFQDVDGTVADAIAVSHQGARNQADLNPQDVYLKHVFTPLTTGTYTFEIRIGIPSGNFYVNGDAAGARLFGGTSRAQLIVEEKS